MVMQWPKTLKHGQAITNSSSEDLETSEDFQEIDPEDEETSSSGSSSGDEVDSDEDEADAEDIRTPATSSPSAILKLPSSPTALKSRLASFIPQLQQANAELETDPEISDKRIDNVADDEQYIEMTLGLGVLKSKQTADDTKGVKMTVSEDSDSSDEGSSSASEGEAGAGTTVLSIVDKLKRVRPAKRKIEEVT
jgi:Domain of unknown function (DUF4598)